MVENRVSLVEVGPRDGFQSVGPFIPTETKIAIIEALYRSGIRRMEATSFVSHAALPQLADSAAVLRAAQALPELDAQVLVPTARHAERAIAAHARSIAFVLSVSEKHNRSNVRRSPAESVQEYRSVVEMAPVGTKIRLNLATAFDCPFEGRVATVDTLALLKDLIPASPDAEVALCDTTGRVSPEHIDELFGRAFEQFPDVSRWVFHAHDTYGLGAANCLTAWKSGVRTFDSAIAGLGGCPFAPGATGNVATEDLVWMFEAMGIETDVDLALLTETAEIVATLPGAQTGGRVRKALKAARCRA